MELPSVRGECNGFRWAWDPHLERAGLLWSETGSCRQERTPEIELLDRQSRPKRAPNDAPTTPETGHYYRGSRPKRAPDDSPTTPTRLPDDSHTTPTRECENHDI